MHLERIIPVNGKGFPGLLDQAVTGDRIYLGTEDNLGELHAKVWGLSERGPIISASKQLKYLDGSTIYVGLEEDDQWLPAGEGVVVRKSDGFHYIDKDRNDRIICSVLNKHAWWVSRTGVLIDEGHGMAVVLVEYGFDGSRTLHFSSKEDETEAVSDWMPHYKSGILIDIGGHEGYKVAHVVNDGPRVIVYDELKHGRIDDGSWYAHPIGIAGLRSQKLRIRDEDGVRLLSKVDWDYLASTPALPGILYTSHKNYKKHYYFLVHKD
jgi:hypothetical protein